MTSVRGAVNTDDMRLSVRYDGPEVAAGRIGVRILAPAMASVAQLIDDAARLTYGQDAGVRIEIAGDFRRGSFSYEIVAMAVAAIDPDRLKEILEWLGLIAAPSGLNVMEVLRLLRGRRVRKVERGPGNSATLHAGNDAIQTSVQIASLTVNYHIRSTIEGMTEPLARAGIERVEIGRAGEPPALEVTQADREFFLAPPPDAEQLHDGTATAVLQVVAPVFKLGNKWQFAYPGEASFFAPILDREFEQRLRRREVSFSYGDLVRVEMRTSISRTEAGTLRTERAITKVIEIIPPTYQAELFEPGSASLS